jgi:2-methylisocitrate lyase-like PEP mutase family enzyme
MASSPGNRLRTDLNHRDIIALIGVYDVFSASVAGRHFDGIFISGFSFSASYYGLPDAGYIAWPDIVAFVQRVRAVLPSHHLVVDIDDGYADVEVACHVVRQLEALGASGVVLEDQQRPRKCGHLDGKQIMDLDNFVDKLERVLAARNDLFVVARTDATDPDEAMVRARRFAAAGADAVLVEGVQDLELLRNLRSEVACHLVFNQIAGGKSPPATLDVLSRAGVSLVNYSTPCLFAAYDAIDTVMAALRQDDGQLPATRPGNMDVKSCTHLLNENCAGIMSTRQGIGRRDELPLVTRVRREKLDRDQG